MRTRRNIKHLTESDKTKFVNVVLALKSQPSVLHPTDSSRNRYDDYVEVHMNAMMASPGWAHRLSVAESPSPGIRALGVEELPGS